MEGLIVTTLSAGAVYALIALATTVVFQMVGVLNFSLTIVGTLGAYVTIASIEAGLGTPGALLTGLATAIIASLAVGLTLSVLFSSADMTTKSSVTLIFTLALLAGAERIFGDDPRLAPNAFPEGGIAFGNVVVTYTALIGMALACASVVAADHILKRTNIGFQLRAMSERPHTAMLHALPIMRLTIGIWLVTGVFAFVAILLIMPSRPVSLQILTLLILPGFAAALLGAFKSIHLALVGGFVLGFLEALAAQQDSVIVRSVIPFLVILASLMWLQWSEKWDDAR